MFYSSERKFTVSEFLSLYGLQWLLVHLSESSDLTGLSQVGVIYGWNITCYT